MSRATHTHVAPPADSATSVSRVGRVQGGTSIHATANRAARIAIGATISFQVLSAVLIFLRPDLDPNWHTLSEWAIGPFGWLMSVAFLMSALSYGSLAVAARPHARGVIAKAGLTLLVLCAIGTTAVGLFTTDPLDTPQNALSTTGTIHMIGASGALMLLPVAALLLNIGIARNIARSNSARRRLMWLAGLPLLAFIGFVVHLAIYVLPLSVQYGPGVPLGWPIRLVFLFYMVWVVTLAREVVRVRGG